MTDSSKRSLRKAAALLIAAGVAISAAFVPIRAYAAGSAVSKAAELIVDGKVVNTFASADDAWTTATGKLRNNQSATVKLYANWKPRSYCDVIYAGDSISLTLDLNGFTVDRGLNKKTKRNGYVFNVNDKATFIIEDSAPDSHNYSDSISGGVITGGAGDNCGGGIQLGDNSKLYMHGGSIVGCVTDDHGGAIRVDGDSTIVEIENAGFYQNKTFDSWDSCNGGAIYGTSHCNMTIKNSVFVGNSSEDYGGAIFFDIGSLNVENCVFRSNTCEDDGGAVYLLTSTLMYSAPLANTYALTDCLFEKNHADDYGGAIATEATREVVKLFGNTMTGNTCGENGGAIYVDGKNVCIADSTITGNNADELGGGVFVDSMYDVSIQGCDVITGNTRGGKTADNLFISKGKVSAAHIFNGGLTEGANVCVGTKSGVSEYRIADLTSEYQAQYFHSDDKSLKIVFGKDSSQTQTEHLISSSFGNGDLILPIILIMLLVCSAAVVFAVRKLRTSSKKDCGADDKEDNNEADC